MENEKENIIVWLDFDAYSYVNFGAIIELSKLDKFDFIGIVTTKQDMSFFEHQSIIPFKKLIYYPDCYINKSDFDLIKLKYNKNKVDSPITTIGHPSARSNNINKMNEGKPTFNANSNNNGNGQIHPVELNNKNIDFKLNINADKFDNLVGDDAKFNADKMVAIFKGEDNDFSKAVCLNAAAGLIINETHQNFTNAYNNAREHILSKKVITYLEKIRNA